MPRIPPHRILYNSRTWRVPALNKKSIIKDQIDPLAGPLFKIRAVTPSDSCGRIKYTWLPLGSPGSQDSKILYLVGCCVIIQKDRGLTSRHSDWLCSSSSRITRSSDTIYRQTEVLPLKKCSSSKLSRGTPSYKSVLQIPIFNYI